MVGKTFGDLFIEVKTMIYEELCSLGINHVFALAK